MGERMWGWCMRCVVVCVLALTIGASASAMSGSTPPERLHEALRFRATDAAHVRPDQRRKATKGRPAGRVHVPQADNAPILFGDADVESTLDWNKAGLGQAFRFSDRVTGVATSISVYIDARNKAGKLIAAIYSDSRGAPGRRLALGSLAYPKPNAWNEVRVDAARMTAGSAYWIAVLGEGGSLYFRDRVGGRCGSENSHQTTLRSLPRSWKRGRVWRNCPISAHVDGPAPPGGGVGGSTGTGTGAPAGGQTGTGGFSGAAGGTQGGSGSSSSSGGSSGGSGSAGGSGGSSSGAPVNLGEPVATGTVATGQTLFTTDGTWSNGPASYSYQWQDCPTDGSACANISGATSQTYEVQSSDSGDVLRALVTASNGSGSSSPTASPMIPFGDVFSGSSVDPNVWDVYSRHGDSTQPEPECYVTGNLTEGSNLMTELVEKQTVNPCPYGQGQATTTASYASAETQAKTFNFEYGTLRAKIEFSGGTSWPALWMLGSATCEFPNNLDVCPGCNIGHEVDIAEINNNNQNEVDEYDNAAANCSFPGCQITGVADVSHNYHIYEFDWTSSQMVFKIDGTTECTIGSGGVSAPIANLPMFPIIDTAMNTSYGVTDATLPQSTKVAWIYITTNSPSNVTPPALTDTTSAGRFQHGDTLSVSNGTWGSGMSCGSGGVTCTYEWKHCDPSATGSGFCTVISGATSSTYTLATGDEGDYITASVTASTANGASSTSTPLSIAVT